MPRKNTRTVFAAISPVIVMIAVAGALSVAHAKEWSARSNGGMVASACPEATAAGVRVFESGGNAVDAAIAVGFALAVSYPSAGNIGGGGFMLVRMAGGESSFFDFREKAPMLATRDMYLDEAGDVTGDMSVRGHLASGVPGSVAGLWMAHDRYGSKKWEELLAPAIELAEKGFEVSPYLAFSLEEPHSRLSQYPGLSNFFGDEGMPLEAGDLLIQPDLAMTLSLIADQGPAGFYEGRTARLIAEEMRRGGGIITAEDLASYEAVEREPVRGSYRGFDIISAPPPSSGGIVLLEILNIIEGYSMDRGRDIEAVHLVIEAERRAYADRARWLGDSDFVDIPADNLISKDYADKLRNDIKYMATPSAELDAGESEETTHYSVVDSEGNAVAVTTTLNGSYGSYVVIEGAGFLMNNEMDDFSIKPGVPNMYGLTGGEANAIEPGKRMLSSMTPTIVLRNGEPWLVLGSPGGSTIITTVAQVVMNIIDFGMEPLEAVSAGRYHHQWSPDMVYYEEGAFTGPDMEGLRLKGYELKERSLIGDVQLIVKAGASLTGVSDPRRGGSSLGTGTSPANRTDRKEN
jgi:gamma-glutamyltranspeptidase/glutathione hydrolase